MKKLWDVHKEYVFWCYRITFYVGFIYGIYNWFKILVQTVRAESFVGFILVLVGHTLITFTSAILTALVWGTISVVIFLIPYLIIRGILAR